MSFSVPVDAERYLTRIYGGDWRTPKPGDKSDPLHFVALDAGSDVVAT